MIDRISQTNIGEKVTELRDTLQKAIAQDDWKPGYKDDLYQSLVAVTVIQQTLKV